MLGAGFPTVTAIVSLIILIVGGSVALTFGWSRKHLLWGIVFLLLAVVVVIMEGSYRVFRRAEDELAAERAGRSATEASLRAERERPVSHEHRDRLREIASLAYEEIRAGRSCIYGFGRPDDRDAQEAFASHFPDRAAVLDNWDSAVTERDAAAAEFMTMVGEFTSQHWSSAPWNLVGILGAFQERIKLCSQDRSGVPEFELSLAFEEGKLLWRIAKSKPMLQYLNFELVNGETSPEQRVRCQTLFEKWFELIRISPEFKRLRVAWQAVHDLRQSAVDALDKVYKRDEIYGRCGMCGKE
jgi:hypothetical protein